MSNLVSQWKSLLIWDSLYDYLSCKWVEVALHSREKNNLLISKWFCFFITEEFQKFRKVLFILSPAPPFPSQRLVLVCSSLVREPAWSRWRRGLSSSCRTPWRLGTTLVNNVKITWSVWYLGEHLSASNWPCKLKWECYQSSKLLVSLMQNELFFFYEMKRGLVYWSN